jgi:arylsulfatase
MNKYHHVGICMVGGFYLSSFPLQAVGSVGKAPHIILIMTDQQRADALGCAGNEAVISPNIDQLASEGHLFCNAYTAAPSSTPARAGMLTGMSPWHHGLLGYGKVAEHYKYEMPQMLRNLGYHTLGIGKMHWTPQNALHGFETTLIDESGRVESPYFKSDYRKWFDIQAFGLNPDSTGVDWNGHGAKAYALPERLHPTVWTGDRAVEAIRGYSSEKPLFLKISFARPHSPYDAPQRIVDMYVEKNIPAPVVGDWCADMPIDGHPELHPTAAKGNFGIDYAKNSRKYYYASITFIDEQVGRIMEELKKKGMYDEALICFVADHGDMLGDHNMWRKTYAYEGSAAIPFIIKLPEKMEGGLKKGEVLEQPVELRDLLPTFLDMNHQKVPEDMDGASLLPLLQKEKCIWRKYIDIEHSTAYWEDNYWCALTDGKIKYIWFFRTGQEQLFDLVKDPHELNDVSGSCSYRGILKKMRQAMINHLKERGEEWVKDNRLMIRNQNLLYSPNYPKQK